MHAAQRICSLLPSATEIVFALGLEDRLVAVTHECDFPPKAQLLPRVTSSVIDSEGLSAQEIDLAVRSSLEDSATIYHLDANLLRRAAPDLILTQELCNVCAVGPADVQSVLAKLDNQPQVVSLEPRTLDEVLESILLVGRLAQVEERAEQCVAGLRERLALVQRAVSSRPVVSVLTMEWTDPLFVGGHWVPEMVRLAGGHDVLGVAGAPSRVVTWDEVSAHRPDVVVSMPCGFGLQRSRVEMDAVTFPAAWDELPAVESDRVYVVDGSSYFNRPGPRVVDGVEILASILHPEVHTSAPSGSYERYKLRHLSR